jgi:L-serine dehydratase
MHTRLTIRKRTERNHYVNTSLFELFKIGIGPSSSHTVGPMRAALRFLRLLESTGSLPSTAAVNIDLYGSLALTGIGHGTDRAVLLGLLGEAPDTIDPATVETSIATIRSTGQLNLGGQPASAPRPDVP